jgi:putative phosphoribosyl transferase
VALQGGTGLPAAYDDIVLFSHRRAAGGLLAERLQRVLGDGDVVVLGLPRGGVVVAAEIAFRLRAPLDVCLVHKIGAPGNPELAIGGVDVLGHRIVDEGLARQTGADPEYIRAEVDLQVQTLQRRALLYRAGHPPVPLKGHRVLVVDDGVATGASIFAALASLRHESPAALLVAVPVAPAETLAGIAAAADAVTCLASPRPFYAVGNFYERWDQISDEQVQTLLEEARHHRRGHD